MENPGEPDAPADLVALTRKRKDGTLYFRRSDLVAEIRKAQARPLQELLSGSPKVSDLCLLYFVRNYWPNGVSATHEALVTELLRRIDRRVVGLTTGIGSRRRDIREDVRGWFVEQIFARSNKLDVYEYAFGLAIKARVIDRIRYYELHDGTEIGEGTFAVNDEDSDGTDAIDALNLRSRSPQQSNAAILTELREALSALNPKQRQAVLATEYFGLDQDEAGTIVGVGKRRIRQLIQEAKQKVADTEGQLK